MPRRLRATGSKNKWAVLAGIFVLAISLGILRFNLAEKNIGSADDLWSGKPMEVGQNASLSGMIDDEPEIKENNQKLTVDVGSKKNLRILITTDFNESYRYGDVISFYGKLEKPENFVTNTGKVFDYVNYLIEIVEVTLSYFLSKLLFMFFLL